MGRLLKISQQTLWQVLGKFITSLSTIAILAIISRNFGETGTGVFTLALTYLAFFTLVIDFGVNAHLLPILVSENFELTWRKLFGFRLLLAIFLIPLALLGGMIWPTDTKEFKTLILIGSTMAILGPAVYVSANAIFQSKFRYDLSVIGWSAASLTTLALIYTTGSFRLSLPWIMFDYSVGWLTGSLLLLFFVKKFVKIVWPVFDIKFAFDLIKQSWPISLTLVLNVIYFRLDSFLLSFMKGFADVGVYNLSYQLFQTALVLPTFIMNAFYPLMLKVYSQDKQKFAEEIKYSVLGMLSLGLVGVLLTSLLGKFFIELITGGQGFIGSEQALFILSLGFPAFFVSAALMWVLITLKKYKSMAAIYLIGLLFNGLANWFFIPHYSYIASAWITGVSEYLILLLQLIMLIPVLKRIK